VQVIDVWEPVTESDVQTPLEVYKELQEDGYDVVSALTRPTSVIVSLSVVLWRSVLAVC
jgi:hypothetical protein